MKTSFSTLACPEWGIEQVLDAAALYGYSGVELRVLSHELDLWKLPEFSGEGLAATKKMTEDRGLSVVSIGSSANFHSPDSKERDRNLDMAMRMAEVAFGVGAPSVRVFPDKIQEGCTRQQTVQWIAQSLNLLAERLKPSGMEVWLETHGDFANPVSWCEIIEQFESPNLGIIWDPANAFIHGDELAHLPESAMPWIRHVHIKDLRHDETGTSHYVLTGEGEFPFDTLFASLDQIGYDGFVSFEWERQWHPELASAQVALPHFIDWWKQKKGSA